MINDRGMVTDMVVKESRGRRRYIAFSLGESIPKDALESRLSSTGYRQIRVIQCAGGWCILRCEPRLIQRSIAIMKEMFPDSESKSTSGNILTLRRKYPILWETRPRYMAFTVSADAEVLSDGIRERSDDDGPYLKFCDRGYAIVKCTLRDTDRTLDIMKGIDPSSQPFLSSYNSKDLRRDVSNRVPELRPVLLARK